ncbi:large conductance mechanosensitive channel protein MscL [Acetivibrio cellulolyticus]|uniref:large conductance mechanosensitive channel protein MscL n=1 Tax=Acetivibrio cellulolyticus TaxID=35830 RepID=UPI0001E2D91D|nr:large conductance mechanosensitive channel protein MscL [Acetivibrio cellulolyticus]
MWKEFKEFALKGNVLDLAVGVVIGAAFGKIVTSLVNDIIMPVISVFTKGLNFENLFVSLDGSKYATLAAAKDAGAATLNYGLFISNIIDFLIIAFSIFIVVRQLNRFTKKKEEPAPKKTKQCKYCFSEIHIDATKCPHCTSDMK